MRVLFTGRGSIAQRHVRHLRELLPDADVAVIAAGQVATELRPCVIFDNLQAGLAWKPDAVVVASISSSHFAELAACIKNSLPCLVEKPLVTSRLQLEELRGLSREFKVPNAFGVGCNLRYLPALRKLRGLIAEGPERRILRAQLEVGQHLAQWRPGRGLKTSYSASAAHGGGVVFDLVHEIDMARWLLGPLAVHSAVAGHFSTLPIEADDVHVALLKTARGAPVVVSLDYVSLQAVRRYAFVTSRGTYVVDLMAKNTVLLDNEGLTVINAAVEDYDVAATYRIQMMDWLAAIREPERQLLSPFSDALATAELMLKMQEASA